MCHAVMLNRGECTQESAYLHHTTLKLARCYYANSRYILHCVLTGIPQLYF